MTNDADIRRNKLLDWKRYAGKTPDEALKQIYDDAHSSSEQKRGWYWNSIKSKRIASFLSRGMVFALLALGTALPLLAGLGDHAETRLRCTQIAITLLAVAGLLQIADKAFGWSSGWMRYITTATAMESSATTFELAWAKHFLSKTGALDSTDVQVLFALAEQFERDLIKLQSDETNGWITEFNAGINLIDAAIKAQRDETQKQLEALRVEATAAQADAKAQEKAKAEADLAVKKAQEPGAIDLSFSFNNGPKPIVIQMDGAIVEAELLGSSWSRGNIPPGLHAITVKAVGDRKMQASVSVSVEPGKIARSEIKIPI